MATSDVHTKETHELDQIFLWLRLGGVRIHDLECLPAPKISVYFKRNGIDDISGTNPASSERSKSLVTPVALQQCMRMRRRRRCNGSHLIVLLTLSDGRCFKCFLWFAHETNREERIRKVAEKQLRSKTRRHHLRKSGRDSRRA